MHVAGFSFAILSDGFVVHRGFKHPGAFHPNKDVEQERNRILFRQFKRDLGIRYKDSDQAC